MSKLNEKCATNALTHTLPAGTSSSGNIGKSTSLGVHKFCSKLRHKIEDNLTTARLANKFVKASRHSISMSSLSGLSDATIGKYTNKTNKCQDESQINVPKKGGMLKYKRIITKSTQHITKDEQLHEQHASTPIINTPAVSFIGTYIDSDDEYPLPSLSLTKQSLEDEIFEELEKVAHDEHKLNTVLKTFDRILTDFHDDVEAQHLLAVSKAAIHAQTTITKHESELNNMEKEEVREQQQEQQQQQQKQKQPTNLNNVRVVIDNNMKRPKLEKCRTTLCENKLLNSKKLNKSVLDITAVSKIPVWKALPLSVRSKSFCYAPIEETLQKLTNMNATTTTTTTTTSQNKMLRKRAVSYTTLPQHVIPQKQQRQKQQQQSQLKGTSAKLIKSKTELNVKMKTKGNIKATTTNTTNLRRSHTNSDELLDKCLEKGQQILRKIESLGTKQNKQEITTTTTLKDKKKSTTMMVEKVHNLNETMTSPILELKYMAQKGRQNSDSLSDDSGHISNEAHDNQQSPLSESSTSTSTLGSSYDYDYEAPTPTPTPPTSTSSSPFSSSCVNKTGVKSSKIYQLLQKFENKTTPATIMTINDNKLCNKTTVSIGKQQQDKQQKQQICTSLKVAEVEGVHCIKTHIEIFPNYSKEVTTWFY